VRVVQEGNVVPWLLASRVLVHNGCTTSVEAWILGRAAVAFLPLSSASYDVPLPNELGFRAKSEEELVECVGEILREGRGAPLDDPAQRALVAQNVVALDGPLACDRIVAALEAELARRGRPPLPGLGRRLRARALAGARALVKRTRARLPSQARSRAYERHRYPEVGLAALEARIELLAGALGRFRGLRVRPFAPDIFEIQRR
jgi:hypothetical protein